MFHTIARRKILLHTTKRRGLRLLGAGLPISRRDFYAPEVKQFFFNCFKIKKKNFSQKSFSPKKKKIFFEVFFPKKLKKSFCFKSFFSFFNNFLCKTFYTSVILQIYHAHCNPFNKNTKIDERRIKSSLNTAHSAVAESSPSTFHSTSFSRGLRSRRNSGETQQLDHTQGLNQSSEVNDR